MSPGGDQNPQCKTEEDRFSFSPENPPPDRLLRALLTWDASRAARVGMHTYLPGHTSPQRCPWESWAQQKPRLTGDLEGCAALSHGSSADSGHERNEQQFLMNSLQFQEPCFHGLEPRTHHQCFKSKCAPSLSEPLAVYGRTALGEHHEGSSLQVLSWVLAWCVHTHPMDRPRERAGGLPESALSQKEIPPATANQEHSCCRHRWDCSPPPPHPSVSSGRSHSRFQEGNLSGVESPSKAFPS